MSGEIEKFAVGGNTVVIPPTAPGVVPQGFEAKIVTTNVLACNVFGAPHEELVKV